jgi:tetratricopeptide (TPR) repeat protein
MAKRRGFRIFISAVTGELGSYRQALARELRRKGVEVCDQEHFRQGGATLLEALRDYIRDCDAVVLLIGHRCGDLATPEHAAVLGDIASFKAYSAATGQTQASYTQWELHLAQDYGKKTYTFIAKEGFVPDPAVAEAPELRACQQAHRAWIERIGKHHALLTTSDRLAIEMLVQDFPAQDLAGSDRPKPANLPYRSLDTLFKGRDAAMAQLARNIGRATGARASAIVGKANTVFGLGGVGKTRLAVEYAWQHADDYNALLFVAADSPEKLQASLAALAAPAMLDLPEHRATEQEAKVAAVLAWLGANPGWFLILDNADTREAAAAAEALLPQLAAGDVLITSRLSRWSGQVEPLELDVLGLDDAVAFLLERTERRRRKAPTDAADARTLAKELGELALALEQAGAYIEEQRLSFAQYLAQWQSNRDKVAAWFDPQVMQYPGSLAVTWQTSVAQLSDPARRLLERLAWLAPDPIPELLLDVAVPGDDNAVMDARAALANLERHSLVARASEPPTFMVHRLVQDVTRRSLKGEASRIALTQALAWVNGAFVGDPGDTRTWLALEPLAPHAAAVALQADSAGIPEPTARLMNELGRWLNSKALHAQGEALFGRVIASVERALGADHPNVAVALNNLARLLQVLNRSSEAEPLMRRALAIDEKSFGLEHPNVAIRFNNLANLLQATNRLGEAEPLMRRALAIDEKCFGPEHPNVAIRLNNLANLLQDTNRLAEAEALCRRALAIDEKSYGPAHPNVAVRLDNLAQLYEATNRLAEAEPLMRRALVIDETSLGPDHPTVVVRMSILASLLSDLGRPHEAEPLRRRDLRITECELAEGHPHIATALNNLASLLQDSDRVGEAEPLMRRVLVIDERSFGPEHPKVATDLNNLAQLLQDANRFGEAEPLLERAICIWETSLGPDHPQVAFGLNNLANLLAAMNRPGEAEPLSRRHLQIFFKYTSSTRREHPHLGAALGNYTGLLRDMGRTDAEISTQIEALAREAGLEMETERAGRPDDPAQSSPPRQPEPAKPGFFGRLFGR